MSEELFKYLVLFHEEIEKTLKDKNINNYTRWKYEKYEKLCHFLLEEYGI